ncbi:MAG: hypothetical protein H0T50_15085 [Gemmatimonadales bacterium]|nr:hypothetical protein [Gemmatimonadales bacterium]
MAVRKKPKSAKRVRETLTGGGFVPAAKSLSRRGKVRKEFWLDPGLLREAQEYLGTSTERETVELALDLVAFRKELSQGARALRGLHLSRID